MNQTAMEKIVSILIPVYNVESYLVECIESTQEQGLDPDTYEVIAVEDHSTDSSCALLRKLERQYANLSVYNNPNKGLSAARNYALTCARGKYVLFLDSDDYLSPNVLGQLVAIAEKEQLEVVGITRRYVDVHGNYLEEKGADRLLLNSLKTQTGRDFLLLNKYEVLVTLYIWRRDFLEQNALQMAPLVHEDEEFTPRALALCHRMRFVPIPMYCYRQRDGSIMSAYKADNLMDILQIITRLRLFFAEHFSDDQPLMSHIEQRCNELTYVAIRRAILKKLKNELQVIQQAREQGLLPIPVRGSFGRWLLNVYPRGFIWYYGTRCRFRRA